MSRDETRFSPDVGSLYSFVEVTNWTVTPTQCTFAQKGGITSNYGWSFTGYSQLEWGEGGTWHDFGTEKSGSFTGYGDKVYDSHTSYFTRQSSPRTVYLANYAHAYVNGQSSSARAYIQFTVPALPPNATTLTATRNSDTSVSLSWATSMGYAESVKVERSTDGSAYSEIAVLSNLASSYTDSTTSADHSYTYRWRYYNVNAYGGYSATASVTMTPTPPDSISLERADATDIDVTLSNTSMVATSLEWQASYDGGDTWSASTTVNGSPVTSFTATTSGGTVLIRVRNVNSVGNSEWIVSDSIVTITPPNPPTLISPTNVFNMSAGSVTFQWLHNPKDGSAQSAAQLAYSTNGGSTWTTVTLTTAQSYTITPLPWAAGTTVTWRVRTKGADANYGDWASSKQFTCYQVPSLTFTASNPPSTVTALPIPIEVTYSDPQSVACAAASVLIQQDGRTIYTEPLTINGNTLSGSITASELLPVNGESYTVVVTARSGTSLQTSANTTFLVSYTPPVSGDLGITNDPETGYVSLIAEYTNDGVNPDAESITVIRVNPDGTTVTLLENGESGAGITDMYAPLNTPYRYDVVTYAASGAYAVASFDNTLESTRWFAYWKDSAGNDRVAHLKWNPGGSYSLSRPEKKRVRYAGRKWPVSYDSKAMEQSHSMSWLAVDIEDWENGFKDLMNDGGRGVYKGCDGWVFHADFEYSAKPNYTSITRLGQISLTITRIDGEIL